MTPNNMENKSTPPPNQPEVFEILVNDIVPSPFEAQARRRKLKFETEIGQIKINELGESILAQGLLQPIRVRRVGTRNEIVYGERRWLAHKAKGLTKIFCFVSEQLSDAETLKLQYFENHERDEPDALEDALRFKYLIEHEKYTEEKIASEFASTKPTVRKKLRLTNLIPEALAELSDGLLPLKHAYYLATFPAESQKKIVAREYAYEWRGKQFGAMVFDEFKETVEENIVRNLATAPFDPADTRLHIKGLTCWECPKRTGNDATLFEDDFKGDSCLDESCFSMKTNVNLKIKQSEIAEQVVLPVITDDSAGDGGAEKVLEKKIASVPLVTRRSTVSKKELPIKGEVLTNQEIFDKPMCEFSVLSLDIDKGRDGYVCENDECPTHHPEKISDSDGDEKTGPTDDELEQMEKSFQIKVAMTVREKVLAKSTEHFNGSNSFWQYADLIEKLLVEIVLLRWSYLKELESVFTGWKNFPKQFDRESVEKFVGELDSRRRDQLLFLCAFAAEGFMLPDSEYNKSQTEIEKLAKSYAKVDYDRLDADVRVELAPVEFKAEAEKYRDEFQKTPMGIPRFWWFGFEFPKWE